MQFLFVIENLHTHSLGLIAPVLEKIKRKIFTSKRCYRGSQREGSQRKNFIRILKIIQCLSKRSKALCLVPGLGLRTAPLTDPCSPQPHCTPVVASIDRGQSLFPASLLGHAGSCSAACPLNGFSTSLSLQNEGHNPSRAHTTAWICLAPLGSQTR